MDENSRQKPTQTQNSPRWRNMSPNTDPKIAQDGSMSPIWCLHSPKCPHITQNGPREAQYDPNACSTKANTNHKIPLRWLNMSPIWCGCCPNIPEARNMGKNDANGARLHPDFLQIKKWVCTCSMPPPTPPRAKLHQLLALFQRFPSSKVYCFGYAPMSEKSNLPTPFLGHLRYGRNGVFYGLPPFFGGSCAKSTKTGSFVNFLLFGSETCPKHQPFPSRPDLARLCTNANGPRLTESKGDAAGLRRTRPKSTWHGGWGLKQQLLKNPSKARRGRKK